MKITIYVLTFSASAMRPIATWCSDHDSLISAWQMNRSMRRRCASWIRTWCYYPAIAALAPLPPETGNSIIDLSIEMFDSFYGLSWLCDSESAISFCKSLMISEMPSDAEFTSAISVVLINFNASIWELQRFWSTWPWGPSSVKRSDNPISPCTRSVTSIY